MESVETESPCYIQILPNELLAAIFRAGSFLHRKRYEITFPELVCTVNKHWRSVAINTPDIWCDIRISSFRPIEASALWFERSKSCLLNVTLDAPPAYSLSTNRELAYVPLVHLHLPRWRRLVVKASRRDDIEDILFSFRDAQAPRLEEVRVRVRNPEIGQDGVHTDFLTPSLRSVRFQGVCLHCPSPLAFLTFIEFRGFEPTYTAFRDIIAASPSLSHLVLSKIECILPTEVHDMPMIEVPSLRSLAIGSGSVFAHAPPPCGCILCVLFAPNLDSLEICGDVIFPYLVRHFQADSSRYSNVRTLRLQGVSWSPSLLDIFRALPMVTHLQLIDTLDDILANFPEAGRDIEDESDALWPNLRVITLDTLSTERSTLLRDVVTNRITRGTPLSKVRLSRAAWSDSGQSWAWSEERVQVELIGDDENRFKGESEDDSDSDDSWESSIYESDGGGDWDHNEDSDDDNYEDYEVDEMEDEDWGLEGVESYHTMSAV